MTQNSYIATINYVENTYSNYIAIYIAVNRNWPHQLKVYRETRVVNTSPTRCNPYFGRIIQSVILTSSQVGIGFISAALVFFLLLQRLIPSWYIDTLYVQLYIYSALCSACCSLTITTQRNLNIHA